MSVGYDFLNDEAYGANRVEDQQHRDRLLATGNNDSAYDDFYGNAPDRGDDNDDAESNSVRGSMALSEVDDRATSVAPEEPAAQEPVVEAPSNLIEEEQSVPEASPQERRHLRHRAMAIRTQSMPGALSPGRQPSEAGFLPRTASLKERGVEPPISRAGTAFEDRGTWWPQSTPGVPGDRLQSTQGVVGADQGSRYAKPNIEGNLAELADARGKQEARNEQLRLDGKISNAAVPEQARVPIQAGVQPAAQPRVGHRLWGMANKLTRANRSWGARIRNFFAQSSFLRRLGLRRSDPIRGSAGQQMDANYARLQENVKESDFPPIQEASEEDERDDDE